MSVRKMAKKMWRPQAMPWASMYVPQYRKNPKFDAMQMERIESACFTQTRAKFQR